MIVVRWTRHLPLYLVALTYSPTFFSPAAPGGGGGALPVGVIRSQPSHSGNRRVGNVGGGGYWWQSNNPFVGAGSRAPSSGGGGGGGGLFPASGGGVVGSFPGGHPTKFPLGGSSFPASLQPIDNSIVGPMGICPQEFVCVHWQLCRNGQVILDGTGIIDKSKRRPAGQVRWSLNIQIG